MFTLVWFRFPFPFQLVFYLSFQFSSKRMPQTQAIAAHIHASHMCPFIFLFPSNLLFLFPFNFHQSACLRHKQYMSTFMHYVHQPRSLPMTYASLMSPLAITYAFDEHKNARMWTSIVYPLVLWHMPSMNVKTTPIKHAVTHVSLASLLVLWHMPLTNVKKQVCGHSIKLRTHHTPWSHCAVCIQFALGA